MNKREELIQSGRYTEEVMAKAEEIFSVIQPTGLPSPFERWLDSASAPTQSYFAKLAIQALNSKA